MLKTYKNEMPVTQIVYDIKMEPIQVAPGQTVQYDAGPLDWPVHSHESAAQGGRLNPAAVIGGGYRFEDNFDGDELFWGWYKEIADAVAGIVSINQEGGCLKISIDATTETASWDQYCNFAPKALFTLPELPALEVVAKISSYSLGNDCQAGIIIQNKMSSHGPGYALVRRKSLENQGQPAFNGVAVARANDTMIYLEMSQDNVVASIIYLRVRFCCTSYGMKNIIFSYSLDGEEWLGNWICQPDWFSDIFVSGSTALGLFVCNDITHTEGERHTAFAWFDFMKMNAVLPDS
jgi:hypothetical protein